jgi:hypothetical protein
MRVGDKSRQHYYTKTQLSEESLEKVPAIAEFYNVFRSILLKYARLAYPMVVLTFLGGLVFGVISHYTIITYPKGNIPVEVYKYVEKPLRIIVAIVVLTIIHLWVLGVLCIAELYIKIVPFLVHDGSQLLPPKLLPRWWSEEKLLGNEPKDNAVEDMPKGPGDDIPKGKTKDKPV